MDTLRGRVRQYIEDHGMICPGDTVVAGVSGGADSLCLLLLLHELSGQMGFSLQAVHVHHGLRAAAREDLEYVEELCGQMKVPCTVFRVDAAGAAKEWGIGVEEAGRRLRYDAFRQACRHSGQHSEQSSFRIAVAHHREDQAETVLFHLCRGTDLRGARGMLPVNGQIIRPLLAESRAAIEAYLTEKGMKWREDETNEDTSYTRNYLRREILPRLEQGVNAAAAQRISQFASACAEAEEYLTAATERALERCRAAFMPADRILIPESCLCRSVLLLDALLREEPYLQGRIFYRCLADSTKTGRDIGTVHVDALRRLCRKQTDGQLSMPDRVMVLKCAGKLFFCRGTEAEPGPHPQSASEQNLQPHSQSASEQNLQPRPQSASEQNLQPASEWEPQSGRPAEPQPPTAAAAVSPAGRIYPVSESGYTACVRDFDGSMSSIPRNEYTKWFDYDKIGTFPVFRTRQPGDYMCLFADAKTQREDSSSEQDRLQRGSEQSLQNRKTITKKLARIMLDSKVSAGARGRIVLPFIGKEALWIPGLRMGDSCKVTPATRKILEIRWNSDRDSAHNHTERGAKDGIQNRRDDQ